MATEKSTLVDIVDQIHKLSWLKKTDQCGKDPLTKKEKDYFPGTKSDDSQIMSKESKELAINIQEEQQNSLVSKTLEADSLFPNKELIQIDHAKQEVEMVDLATQASATIAPEEGYFDFIGPIKSDEINEGLVVINDDNGKSNNWEDIHPNLSTSSDFENQAIILLNKNEEHQNEDKQEKQNLHQNIDQHEFKKQLLLNTVQVNQDISNEIIILEKNVDLNLLQNKKNDYSEIINDTFSSCDKSDLISHLIGISEETEHKSQSNSINGGKTNQSESNFIVSDERTDESEIQTAKQEDALLEDIQTEENEKNHIKCLEDKMENVLELSRKSSEAIIDTISSLDLLSYKNKMEYKKHVTFASSVINNEKQSHKRIISSPKLIKMDITADLRGTNEDFVFISKNKMNDTQENVILEVIKESNDEYKVEMNNEILSEIKNKIKTKIENEIITNNAYKTEGIEDKNIEDMKKKQIQINNLNKEDNLNNYSVEEKGKEKLFKVQEVQVSNDNKESNFNTDYAEERKKIKGKNEIEKLKNQTSNCDSNKNSSKKIETKIMNLIKEERCFKESKNVREKQQISVSKNKEIQQNSTPNESTTNYFKERFDKRNPYVLHRKSYNDLNSGSYKGISKEISKDNAEESKPSYFYSNSNRNRKFDSEANFRKLRGDKKSFLTNDEKYKDSYVKSNKFDKTIPDITKSFNNVEKLSLNHALTKSTNDLQKLASDLQNPKESVMTESVKTLFQNIKKSPMSSCNDFIESFDKVKQPNKLSQDFVEYIPPHTQKSYEVENYESYDQERTTSYGEYNNLNINPQVYEVSNLYNFCETPSVYIPEKHIPHSIEQSKMYLSQKTIPENRPLMQFYPSRYSGQFTSELVPHYFHPNPQQPNIAINSHVGNYSANTINSHTEKYSTNNINLQARNYSMNSPNYNYELSGFGRMIVPQQRIVQNTNMTVSEIPPTSLIFPLEDRGLCVAGGFYSQREMIGNQDYIALSQPTGFYPLVSPIQKVGYFAGFHENERNTTMQYDYHLTNKIKDPTAIKGNFSQFNSSFSDLEADEPIGCKNLPLISPKNCMTDDNSDPPLQFGSSSSHSSYVLQSGLKECEIPHRTCIGRGQPVKTIIAIPRRFKN